MKWKESRRLRRETVSCIGTGLGSKADNCLGEGLATDPGWNRVGSSFAHGDAYQCSVCAEDRRRISQEERNRRTAVSAEQSRKHWERVAEERRQAAARQLRQEAARRTHSHIRRARENDAHGSHSTAEWLLKLREFGGCCAYCGAGGDMQRDHFVPLSRGGSNDIVNIVPACGSCNASKGAKTGAEFMAWLRQRITA